ncbi:LacI family DNA-binding transcriptional regulator [Cyclobacterium plantarum]|uniref:LacI family transcriptional regulator n=1 Tax=Cyclobacterium plantarum TaxID=2716263 RepID=A0ABX0HED3_9BACT|nr:LacI family DNA-binding transcriptional regulator [Cyclobacterium plantarum]NHE58340.1 LacI family transcriptional regulator [Cyclobacterium plantarum]
MKKNKKLSGVKEIARLADVSIATVDRVIHNRSGVSAITKSKIEKIIKELNYQPNILASRLASGKVYRLAVLIPKGSERTDFWDAPLKGIKRAEEEIRQYGISVDFFFFDLNNKDSFIDSAQKIKNNKRFDGVLLAPSFVKESIQFIHYCEQDTIPFVFIDSNIEAKGILSYIGPPLFQSGFLGARLCAIGMRHTQKILFVNISKESNSFNYSKIEEGFKNYFFENDVDHQLIKLDITDTEKKSVFLNLEKIFFQHPDIEVIFVTNSRVFYVAQFLESKKYAKIHLVGYDFSKENQNYLKNGWIDFLICHKPEEQGYKGLMSLYHHIVLKLPVDQIYFMPIDIVTRENQDFYR